MKGNSTDRIANNTRSKTRGVRSMEGEKDHNWGECPYWGRDHNEDTCPHGEKEDKYEASMEAECGHCGGGDGSRDDEWDSCDNCPDGSGSYIAESHPGCKYAPYYGPDKKKGLGFDDDSGPFIAGSHPGCKYAPYHGPDKKGADFDGDERGPFIAGSHPGCRYAPYRGNKK